MASIDKTYTISYEEYKEFKDWVDGQKVTFFDGHTVYIGNWVRNLDKESFSGKQIPIMNTPTWMDIYLIQNCKSAFVLDRMKSVYGEDTYEGFKSIDLTAPPPSEFKQNRKVSIKRSKKTKFPLHSKPYGRTREWWLQCDGDFWYNDETKRWVSYDMPYPHNTNTAHIPSIKALVRHLRKQYLPSGLTFRLQGRYVGETYVVTIS